jgi:hypothetical protein
MPRGFTFEVDPFRLGASVIGGVAGASEGGIGGALEGFSNPTGFFLKQRTNQALEDPEVKAALDGYILAVGLGNDQAAEVGYRDVMQKGVAKGASQELLAAHLNNVLALKGTMSQVAKNAADANMSKIQANLMTELGAQRGLGQGGTQTGGGGGGGGPVAQPVQGAPQGTLAYQIPSFNLGPSGVSFGETYSIYNPPAEVQAAHAGAKVSDVPVEVFQWLSSMEPAARGFALADWKRNNPGVGYTAPSGMGGPGAPAGAGTPVPLGGPPGGGGTPTPAPAPLDLSGLPPVLAAEIQRLPPPEQAAAIAEYRRTTRTPTTPTPSAPGLPTAPTPPPGPLAGGSAGGLLDYQRQAREVELRQEAAKEAQRQEIQNRLRRQAEIERVTKPIDPTGQTLPQAETLAGPAMMEDSMAAHALHLPLHVYQGVKTLPEPNRSYEIDRLQKIYRPGGPTSPTPAPTPTAEPAPAAGAPPPRGLPEPTPLGVSPLTGYERAQKAELEQEGRKAGLKPLSDMAIRAVVAYKQIDPLVDTIRESVTANPQMLGAYNTWTRYLRGIIGWGALSAEEQVFANNMEQLVDFGAILMSPGRAPANADRDQARGYLPAMTTHDPAPFLASIESFRARAKAAGDESLKLYLTPRGKLELPGKAGTTTSPTGAQLAPGMEQPKRPKILGIERIE